MVHIFIHNFNSFKLCMLIRSKCNIQNEHIHLLRVKCNTAISWRAQELYLNVFSCVNWLSFEIALHGFPNLTTSDANRASVKNGVHRIENSIFWRHALNSAVTVQRWLFAKFGWELSKKIATYKCRKLFNEGSCICKAKRPGNGSRN
jgi:hypothetical protein